MSGYQTSTHDEHGWQWVGIIPVSDSPVPDSGKIHVRTGHRMANASEGTSEGLEHALDRQLADALPREVHEARRPEDRQGLYQSEVSCSGNNSTHCSNGYGKTVELIPGKHVAVYALNTDRREVVVVTHGQVLLVDAFSLAPTPNVPQPPLAHENVAAQRHELGAEDLDGVVDGEV
eukprot:2538186-Rhodomonas_salina.2